MEPLLLSVLSKYSSSHDALTNIICNFAIYFRLEFLVLRLSVCLTFFIIGEKMQSIDNIYKYLGKGSEAIFHFLFITHLIFSNYCYIFLAVFMPSEVMHSFVYGQYFLSLTGCLVNEDPATVVCNVWVSAQYMQDICFAARFFEFKSEAGFFTNCYKHLRLSSPQIPCWWCLT